MEYWNNGILEYWVQNRKEVLTQPSIIPVFQCSKVFIPSFQHSNSPQGLTPHTKKGEENLRPFAETSQQSLFFTHILEIGIDPLFLRFLLGSFLRSPFSRGFGSSFLRSLCVHRLCQFMGGTGQFLFGGFYGAQVVGLHCLFCLGDRLFDILFISGVNLITVILQGFLSRVDDCIEMISCFGKFPSLLIIGCMGLGIPDHLFDLLFVKTTGGSDFYRLFFACSKVFCRDMNDSIGIDIESHFNLGDTPRSGWNANQFKLAKRFVVTGHLPFALENMDRHSRLAIRCRGKNLTLFRWNGGVSFNQFGEDSAQGFDSEGKWGHIEEENIFYFTFEDPRLNGSANPYCFIRIDALVGFFPKDLFHF